MFIKILLHVVSICNKEKKVCIYLTESIHLIKVYFPKV